MSRPSLHHGNRRNTAVLATFALATCWQRLGGWHLNSAELSTASTRSTRIQDSGLRIPAGALGLEDNNPLIGSTHTRSWQVAPHVLGGARVHACTWRRSFRSCSSSRGSSSSSQRRRASKIMLHSARADKARCSRSRGPASTGVEVGRVKSIHACCSSVPRQASLRAHMTRVAGERCQSMAPSVLYSAAHFCSARAHVVWSNAASGSKEERGANGGGGARHGWSACLLRQERMHIPPCLMPAPQHQVT